ncbi:polysaccharide biosynthesis C-terminal domain-containing protein [Myroides sp. 1354]|uniref:lipopolysaccharide biosynthesis protein n=1 Tax=unclassified Myroides TaxID=2642485 RepID=UPI002576CACF|nr:MULTISPECIES: polysaccharide biosynthesis C-terminal domain-containing protein [unclassified Myroides]MDM1043714.1 polysaccharide biosynthesis C-terminal domain-containing protein [Myroides sp. R163-1]MDM1054236.1 polysaccharide biosynthesis C-terminal domain-containing protein [Myroides sp. 1354]MDM1067532.1 polysaccharide biosynthesis C-terminal domain-containing protein [Myroides sp. 1372]
MNLKIVKDLVLNNLSQGLQFGLQWVLNIVILSILGMDFFGSFSFYYSIANFLMPILPFGSFVFLMKKEFDNQEDAAKELAVSFQLQLLFFGVISICSSIFWFFYPGEENFGLLVVALLNGYFLSLNTLMFIFHKSLGDFKIELVVNLFKSLLIGGLIVGVYLLPQVSVLGVLIVLLLINSITFFLTFLKSNVLKMNYIKLFFRFDYKLLKRQFTDQKYYGLQDILTVSFVQGGMLLLPLLVINEIYGMYRGLLLIVAPFGLLNLTFSQVLLNQLKSKTAIEKGQLFHLMQKIAVGILLIVLVVMYVLRAFVMEKIAKVELNEETNLAFIGLCIVIVSSFVYSGYEMLLVALNKQKMRLSIMIVGATANMIAIFSLLPQFGLLGAISTNVISSVIVFISIMWIAERELKRSY